ncbi:T-cell surface glycoprotein CD5 [Phascolarctos cinereus]|uniref:T-cell surface glycoprotein CD5 n=1 Tax=Phascolarctos cinereus TaxID=38626 RepID=A0A6P5JKT3_PHACI|nr:T-cell surface glycoprotein CD5 [Phascolarctos cinereus]XP_020831776.1 T-cell surface glycoprotein CD5 [Phascolarctos cinereus]
MGLCWSPLTLLCLLGILVSSCHGGPQQIPSGSHREFTGSSPLCQVQLDVKINNTKSTLCLENRSGQALTELSSKLGFQAGRISDPSGAATELACSFHNLVVLHKHTNTSSLKLHVICQEAATKAPLPTPQPTVTSPKPTGPPRFLLVEGKEKLRCAGVVEFYRGSVGGSICYEEKTWTKALGDEICQALNCGTFLSHLYPPAEKTDPGNPKGLKPLPILWAVEDAQGVPVDQVFTKQKSCPGNRTISIVCSDFQPKVKSRLKGGNNPCKGIVEVYFEGQWKVLCGKKKNWEEVCEEQHCGSLISEEVSQKSSSAPSSKLYCPHGNLSHCYTFDEGDPACKGTMIECQDPNAGGPGAGTVMSIILTFILMAIVLVTCGPVAYKKLEKKFRQKKQRQWIGPTGVNQNVSFHRNHTVTIRSQVENPGASNVENEYSQPPRHSRLSAYPALEGALNRSSNPPDNSSDSDYDLHGAQRL